MQDEPPGRLQLRHHAPQVPSAGRHGAPDSRGRLPPSNTPTNCKLIRATVATVSKTKELKKRSWGQERVGLVSFGSCLPCERFALLSVLELMCVAQKRRC